MKIPIIFDDQYKCWKCGAIISVYYPPKLASKYGLGNIRKVYSNTMQEYTVGNICPICASYQGNHYVWDDAFVGRCYDTDFIEKVVWVDEEVKCNICGKVFGENDFNFFNENHRVSTLCDLLSEEKFTCDECEKKQFDNDQEF